MDDLLYNFYIACRYFSAGISFTCFWLLIYKGVLSALRSFGERKPIKMSLERACILGWVFVNCEATLEVIFFPTIPGVRVVFVLAINLLTIWLTIFKFKVDEEDVL